MEKEFRKTLGRFSFFIAPNHKYRLCQVCIGRWTHEEGKWSFCLAIPYLIYLNVIVKGKSYPNYWQMQRELKFYFAFNAFWWNIWKDPDHWSSKDGWRRGALHFDDLFLGKVIHSDVVLEEREVFVPMPEKSYKATAKLTLDTWKRPRWFKKQARRVHIDVPGGIPFEGKGENSYDCGPDAIFGITCDAETIPEGVGKLVGSVLKDRVKNGGWKDWSWARTS